MICGDDLAAVVCSPMTANSFFPAASAPVSSSATVGAKSSRKPDRFESARGKADIKWRTDDLMALLRGKS